MPSPSVRLGLILIVGVVPARAGFVETPAFGTGLTIPFAVGDVDGDLDLDLAVGNFNQANALYRNEDGAFSGGSAFGAGATFAVAFADVDQDGDLDLAVGNGAGQANGLYLNDGAGGFTPATNPFGNGRTIAIAWGDVDLDGDLDLAVGNGILGVAEDNVLYRNAGDGTFVGEPAFGAGQTASLILTDLDGDGDLDAAVGNGGFGAIGQNALYLNQGDGTFVGHDEFGLGDTACLVAGDLDNDGDVDVAVGNWGDVDAQNRVYLNDGSGVFTGSDAFGARDTNTLALGDADHDGDLDVAVGNGDFSSADQNELYLNDGAAGFTASDEFGVGSTDAIVFLDADGDGDLDAAIGNEHSPTTNYLYVNDTDDDAWLVVALEGRAHLLGDGYSNRDGIGARVLVYAAGHVGEPEHLLGLREVLAHGGFASQSQIPPHFGLPGPATVDVRVEWPGSNGSRIVQDVVDVTVGTRIEIVEGEGAVAVGDAVAAVPGGALRMHPNPTHGGVRVSLSGVSATGLEIFDVTGRRVRALTAPSRPDHHEVVWDGRDEAGRPVTSGTYFVITTGDGPRWSGRVSIRR